VAFTRARFAPAQALCIAAANPKCGLGVRSHIEAVGFSESGIVAVGRRIEHRHSVTLTYRNPMQFGVSGCDARANVLKG
jgi:hypothetical protein